MHRRQQYSTDGNPRHRHVLIIITDPIICEIVNAFRTVFSTTSAGPTFLCYGKGEWRQVKSVANGTVVGMYWYLPLIHILGQLGTQQRTGAGHCTKDPYSGHWHFNDRGTLYYANFKHFADGNTRFIELPSLLAYLYLRLRAHFVTAYSSLTQRRAETSSAPHLQPI